MMTKQQEDICRFFAEKAKHLQNEIDQEIEKVGGENMLISRIDLLHWVYYAREQVETYHTVCRMLEDRAEGIDTERILKELRETAETDQAALKEALRKQEEERKALEQLKEEAEYYRLALEVLMK